MAAKLLVAAYTLLAFQPTAFAAPQYEPAESSSAQTTDHPSIPEPNVILPITATPTVSSAAAPPLTPTAARESERGVASAPLPTPTGPLTDLVLSGSPEDKPCTKVIFHGVSMDLSSVCTLYERTVTTTAFIDCGACMLKHVGMGPGPARQCKVWVRLPTSTATVTACEASEVP